MYIRSHRSISISSFHDEYVTLWNIWYFLLFRKSLCQLKSHSIPKWISDPLTVGTSFFMVMKTTETIDDVKMLLMWFFLRIQITRQRHLSAVSFFFFAFQDVLDIITSSIFTFSILRHTNKKFDHRTFSGRLTWTKMCVSFSGSKILWTKKKSVYVA